MDELVQRLRKPHFQHGWHTARELLSLAADRIERLSIAMEEIGGLDCVVAIFRTGKPCGECVSCIARNALTVSATTPPDQP